jgi:Flp pilus assembly protein TadG
MAQENQTDQTEQATDSGQASTKKVTRYSPKGTKVTVSEDQAKKLKGYSSSKPKS